MKKFSFQRVSFEFTHSQPLHFSDSTQDIHERGWKAVCEKRDNLFSAPLLRCIGKEDSEESLVLHVAADVEYCQVVGMRNTPNFLNLIPPEELFQVLSCIACVETTDGSMLLLERDSGDWDHTLELSGGFVRAGEKESDLFSFIEKRVANDLGLHRTDIQSSHFIQLLDFKEIGEMMVVFKVVIVPSFGELQKKSEVPVVALPEGYAPGNHHLFFSLPLHYPSKVVLESLL